VLEPLIKDLDMRKGYDPRLILDKRGEIFAIATGSDACTEHECGSAALQEALCVQDEPAPGFLTRIAQKFGQENPTPQLSESALIALLRDNKLTTYPSLLERKRIVRQLDKVTFLEGVEDGVRVAVLGYSPGTPITLDERELRIWSHDGKQELTGAWDSRSFAFKVQGDKLVRKLKNFYEALLAKDVVFSGLFLSGSFKAQLAGVVLSRESALRPEHMVSLAKAQSEWETALQLKALSRVDELTEAYRDECKKGNRYARLPGYIWPLWKDNIPGSPVVYGLNPSYSTDAAYYGPYTYEQLLDWMRAEKKDRLEPLTSEG
jgi:hypothetical protein